MRRFALILIFLLCGLGYAAIPLSFLGVSSREDPLWAKELERVFYRELRILPRIYLVPREEVQKVFDRGIIETPVIGTQTAILLTKKTGSRIYVFGSLKPMEMEYERTLWNPMRGSMLFRYGLWLKVIDGDNGEIRYSGVVNSNHMLGDAWLGWEPRMGDLDPIFRHEILNDLTSSLAKNCVAVIEASIRGMKAKEDNAVLLQKSQGEDNAGGMVSPADEGRPKPAPRDVRELFRKKMEPGSMPAPDINAPDTSILDQFQEEKMDLGPKKDKAKEEDKKWGNEVLDLFKEEKM